MIKKVLVNKYFYFISSAFVIFILLILSILGNIERTGYLTNFMLINNNNDEYSYSFRISYYSEIFKNSDIYGVYPNLDNLESYIKSINMNEQGSPFGSLISTKELKYDDKIDNIQYTLKLKYDNIIRLFSIILFICMLYFSFYLFLEYLKFKKLLSYNDYMFINILEIVTICLFLFHYWLCFPGYFQYGDELSNMREALLEEYVNWHPIIISLILNILYKIFGYHSFYIYLINLSLWYLGLYIIILTLYIKYKNKLVLLLFFITFLGNFFYVNIIHVKDIPASLFVWLALAIIFLQLNTNFNNKKINNYLYIISITLLVVGMFFRHNFIVTIYPIFIIFLYDKIKFNNIKKYLLKYIILMFIIAIILVSAYKILPKQFINISGSEYATYNTILLQIAGCAVPADDGTMIPKSWYEEGRTFEDVKKLYNKNKLNADQFYHFLYEDRSFKWWTELPNINKVWIKYILKYPINYIKHIYNYSKNIWTIPTWKLDENTIQSINPNINWIKVDNIEFDNYSLVFTPLRRNIYNILYKILPSINISFFVILSIILFIITGITLLLKKELRNNLLVFSFSTSFSAFATAIIVALFTPNAWQTETAYRYMHPIIPICFLSLISFLVFLYNYKLYEINIKERIMNI
ncbi:hypothetical protein, partial [Brachyspira pulli]|uniref:hypothetical protein n=1 Tax=Brachyspira pulli TaxID=310721 RepID=UPI0030067960